MTTTHRSDNNGLPFNTLEIGAVLAIAVFVALTSAQGTSKAETSGKSTAEATENSDNRIATQTRSNSDETSDASNDDAAETIRSQRVSPEKFVSVAQGEWFIQQILGEPMPPGARLKLKLRPDGQYKLDGNALEETIQARYGVGKQKSLLVLHPPKDESNQSSIYFQRGAMLGPKILLLSHDSGTSVLTRQAKHHPDAAAAGRISGIVEGFIDYQDLNEGRFPPDLGALVAEGLIRVDMVTSSRREHSTEVPEGFKGWPDVKKRRWVNQHASYIALGTGQVLPQQISVVELPPGPDYQGKLAVAFGDGHVELMGYDQVNEKIIQQTGKPLSHWRGSRRDFSEKHSQGG